MQMMAWLPTASPHPDIINQSVVIQLVNSLQIADLLCLCCVVRDNVRSLEMSLLVSYQRQLPVLEHSKFKLVHTEGMRVRCLRFRVLENFQKAVLCMHRVSVLRMLRILLVIEQVERLLPE